MSWRLMCREVFTFTCIYLCLTHLAADNNSESSESCEDDEDDDLRNEISNVTILGYGTYSWTENSSGHSWLSFPVGCFYTSPSHSCKYNASAFLWNELRHHSKLSIILSTGGMNKTLGLPLRKCDCRHVYNIISKNWSLICHVCTDQVTIKRVAGVCLQDPHRTNIDCSSPDQEYVCQDHTAYPKGMLTIEMPVEKYRGINISANSTKISMNRSEIQDPNIDVWVPPDLFSRVPWNRVPRTVKFLFSVSAETSTDENGNRLLDDIRLGMEVENVTIENITTLFNLTIHHKSPLQEGYRPKCVFLNQSGHWDTYGCETEPALHQTVCSCNHFSFFGALLVRDVQVSQVHIRVLQNLSYIGCVISATFCTIALLTHCLQRTKGATDQALLIHLQLIGALLLLNLLFLCSVGMVSLGPPALCTAMGLLLHYGLLCCFTWMGLEALHLYRLMIQVYNTYVRHYLLKLCLLGWGAPAVVVVIIIAVDLENYGLIDSGAGEMCWIRSRAVHYSSIVSYLALVLLFNTGVLIYVVVTMVHLRAQKTMQEKGLNSRTVGSVLGLTCALGPTWGLGFLSIGYTNLPILYTFTILNSLQGFFVFLWICLRRRRREDPASVSRTTVVSGTTKPSAPDLTSTEEKD